MTEGSLTAGIEMLRLAQQDKEDADAILISNPPSCESWTKVRVAAINQVLVVVPDFRCRDHDHPLILLRMKETKPKPKVSWRVVSRSY